MSIAFVTNRGNLLSAESQKNQELWKELDTKGILARLSTLCIETSYYELNNELNKVDSGKNNEWINNSLRRLTNTTIEIDTEEKRSGTNFLSYDIDKTTKKIHIAINPVSAVVLLGDKKGFILHNRKERLALNTTPARALYSILVGMVNQKKSKTLSIPMLIEKMHFIEWEESTTQQRKDLKKSFKVAIAEINKLKEWNIKDNLNNTITIIRG